MTFNKKMGSLNSILFIILSINLYQFVFHHPVASTDVLIPGDQVNTTSALVSAGGNFTLGFSQFIHSSNSTYLGIWYTVNNRIVWVANRNMPILKVEDGVVLKIEDSGTLKVVNGRGTTLFNIFYNQVGSGNKTRAVLEDSGNFVVYDELNRTLWQSFDHPIDILISGMKLGYNLTTKQNWTLTSWLSDQVLASGAFTLSLERYQNSPQLLIYRRGVLYWASGPWKDGTFRFLDSFYSSTDLPSYYLSLISDPSGMSVTFQRNEYKLRLNPDGQFDDGSYTPNVGVKFCYGYPSDDGCVVSTLPNCRGQNDSFQWKIGNWSGGPSISDDNSSINLNECMEKCWNKCNCVGFISHSNGVGCTTWVNNSKYMQFIEDPSGTEQQYVLVSQKSLKTTPTPNDGRSEDAKWQQRL